MADNPLYGANLAVSPEALKSRRAMLAELLKQGVDTSPIRSPWQGAARLAQTLVGVMYGNRLDKEEREERQGAIKDWIQARQSGDTAQMQAQLLAHPWLMNAEHLLGATTTPILSGSTQNPNGSASFQFSGPPTIGPTGGGGQPAPPAPARGGPAPNVPTQGPETMPKALPPVNGTGKGKYTDDVATPRPAAAAPGPIPPQAQQAAEQMNKIGMDLGTQGLIRKANQDAWSEDMERYKKAPLDIQNLRLLRNTIESFDPARGDASGIVNRAKQTINGMLGAEVMPETAPAEFMKNIGNVMAMEINKRGTDYGLQTAAGATPSDLQGSKKGALAMTDHLIQMRMQDRKLGEKFGNAIRQYPDNYIDKRNEWLGQKENALTSPLTGKSTTDEASQTPAAKIIKRFNWSPQRGYEQQ